MYNKPEKTQEEKLKDFKIDFANRANKVLQGFENRYSSLVEFILEYELLEELVNSDPQWIGQILQDSQETETFILSKDPNYKKPVSAKAITVDENGLPVVVEIETNEE